MATAVAPLGASARKEGGAPFRFFAPSSFWNQPVGAGAPRDPRSAALIAVLIGGIEQAQSAPLGPRPTIDTVAYSVPIYTVGAEQPGIPVRLTKTSQPELSAAWKNVPIPPGARAAAGADGDLVIWQPSTDRMWEFWHAAKTAEGWHADWGGAMEHVSSNPGVYGTDAWTGAKPWWGVPASSLALVGGLVTFEDLRSGAVEHALAMSIPDVRAGVFASPARRTDGTSESPLSLPEGAHLRLNPTLDLASLHLPPLTLMLARAAQRYGIYVRDGSPNVSFYGQDPTPTGSNPYTGAGGYFEGKPPAETIASFPWGELEVLKMELHPST